MLRFLRREYLTIDPRTLGLVRIAVASLLLIDLVKRWMAISVFYTNQGLIPNHRMLWQPVRRYTLSFLFALSERHEAHIAFALIAIVYLCFLIGYRTRLTHVLSWVCLISLEIRVDVLSNGADFVFSDLVLWTAFLPLGRRFSLDALRASFRAGDNDINGLQRLRETPRDTAPIVSLAVLAATTQLAVIYAFNAISKRGATWHDGSAVYWMVHQERIVTWLGLQAREHLPYVMFQGLTYMTLVVEGAVPLLIMSPWGRPWTRRLAIALIFALHTGIAGMANLGLFSPVMMAFSLLLLSTGDWDALESWGRARARKRVRLYVLPDRGLSFQAARLWVRLDLFRRIELQLMAEQPGDEATFLAVESEDGQRLVREPALRRLLGALPAGVVWAQIARLLRPLSRPLLGWIDRHPETVEAALGLAPAEAGRGAEMNRSTPYAYAVLHRLGRTLGEVGAAFLVIVATWQTLEENHSIPRRLKVHQPTFIRAAVSYFRLNQGWSMFAPEAPTRDQWFLIDAVTVDGRHVDPFNSIGSRVADARLRRIPERLAEPAIYCDYVVRIEDEDSLHDSLRRWIMDYHRRTRRAKDRIVHFEAIAIEQDSPRPGESGPRNVTSRVFLSDRSD